MARMCFKIRPPYKLRQNLRELAESLIPDVETENESTILLHYPAIEGTRNKM